MSARSKMVISAYAHPSYITSPQHAAKRELQCRCIKPIISPLVTGAVRIFESKPNSQVFNRLVLTPLFDTFKAASPNCAFCESVLLTKSIVAGAVFSCDRFPPCSCQPNINVLILMLTRTRWSDVGEQNIYLTSTKLCLALDVLRTAGFSPKQTRWPRMSSLFQDIDKTGNSTILSLSTHLTIIFYCRVLDHFTKANHS